MGKGKATLNVGELLGILPEVVDLIEAVREAVRAESDGGRKVTAAEAAKIGDELLDIVRRSPR
jgi:hypothetical protein